MSGNTVKRPQATAESVAGHFTGIISLDFFRVMTGKWLGGGIARGVYVLGTDPSLVVKIETASYSFQNAMEWEVWCDLQNTGNKVEKWFSPCHYISPCGIVLIQSRTKLIDKSRFPKKMPSFFTDLKYQNFGEYDGRIVAHDYGYNRFIHLGATTRMRSAAWRDDEES